MSISYDLSVELMFLDHDNVDSLGVPESKETEATGTASGTISHYGTLDNFTKL